MNAAIWSGVEHVGANGLSTIFMIAFARVLTPSDFGSFASASLMTGFGGIIAMMGMRILVIQRDELDDLFLSTAFWICTTFASMIALVFILARDQISRIFGDPAVATLLPYVCVAMVASVVNALHTAQLHRDLNMRSLARRTLIANAIAGVIAVPVAFSGFGSAALVVQSVGGVLLTNVLLISLVGWPFKFVFDTTAAKEAVSFGSKVTFAELMVYYDKESPKLIVGIALGTQNLGVFTMALRVMNLFVNTFGQPLANLAVPILSEIRRRSGSFGVAYSAMLRVAASIVMPLFALSAIFSSQIIVILLGDQWVTAAQILSILCGVGVLMVFSSLNGSALLAHGDPSGRLGFASLSALVGTIAMIAALPLGLVGVAVALLCRSLLVEPLQLVRVISRTDISTRNVLVALRAPFIATCIVGAVGTSALIALQNTTDAFVVFPLALALAALYTFAISALDPDLKIDLLQIMRSRSINEK